MAHDDTDKALQERLQRLQAAVGRSRAMSRDERRETRRERRRSGSPATLAVGLALIAAAVATGNKGMLIGGIFVAVFGALRVMQALLNRPRDASLAYVGAGATVEEGAVVEPGAVVEMGATVHSGAVVKRGAVVRMGATVHSGAVIEENASVGWGCDVKADAVVGAGASLGAGVTVKRGAHVPAGLRLLLGATFTQGAQPSAVGKIPNAPVAPVDPRRARIEAACARIEAELEQMPPTFREGLGATSDTATALRETCLQLLQREKSLRDESSDEQLAFLERDQAEVAARASQATDARVKASFDSAVAAIEQQRTQRLALRTGAERLEAEVTRLQFTLEGMATQLVRLRSAGNDAAHGPSQEVLKTVQQLNTEIDAIAESLEAVNQADRAHWQPVSEVGGAEAAPDADGRPRLRT